MSEKVQRILAELRRQFEALYGERLVQMVLYGSQARGDADDESDIDVLVVLRGSVHPGEEIERTGHIVSSVSLAYDVVISRVFVSEERFGEERSTFLVNVRREGVPL